MKTILLNPRLNPEFKTTQPLPLLPADFVVRRSWAARPFAAMVIQANTVCLETAAGNRCPATLRNQVNEQSTRLVA